MSSRPANQQPMTFKHQRGRGHVSGDEWRSVLQLIEQAQRRLPDAQWSRQVVKGGRGRSNPTGALAHLDHETIEMMREMRREWKREPSTYNPTLSRSK